MLDLFPHSSAVEDGELAVGGVRASALAEEFGTPLVVYCRESIMAAANEYRAAAPNALVAYSVKAFPNVALLRLLAADGLGADVSTLGELAFALEGGVPGDRIIMHGNNKDDDELAAAAKAGARYLVLDALDEIERAATAGVRSVLVRVTPGIEAATHPAIRTAHTGSKFGLPAEAALEAVTRAHASGLEVCGLHVHIGSQLVDTEAARATVEWLGSFADECRANLAWTPVVVGLGGGLGIRYMPEDRAPTIREFVHVLTTSLRQEWELRRLPSPELILEPGRSLVGAAGITLYRVGVVKQVSKTLTYVAIDGGMSDNPRPQLYGASYFALLANRPNEEHGERYAVCGKHCESGDVLIQSVRLPEPRRGDLLAVPGTGAYALSLSSNYNVTPRPAAILVADGAASLIRRRETVRDLLALEEPQS